MTIQFSATGLKLTGELEKYANQKLARLSRRTPRRLRAKATCMVSFTYTLRKGVKSNTCDIVLSMDGNELIAHETTQHMYAALDIAAVQIEQQLKIFVRKGRKGLFGRYLRTR